MTNEPDKVQNGLAAALPIVAAIVAIWANLIKGWALVGAVAVSGSVVWLNHLRVSRNGKQASIASLIGVLGIGTLIAAALAAHQAASLSDRNQTHLLTGA